MSNAPAVSVVIPISRVDPDFEDLNRAYLDTLNQSDIDCEIVYIVDVGDDEVIAHANECVNRQHNVRSIILSRQFGDSTALRIGLQQTSGERILVLPAYHQIDPRDVLLLLESLEDCDMVSAVRDRSKESLFGRLQGGIYNTILTSIFPDNVPDMGCEAYALTRQVSDEVTIYGTQHNFLPLLVFRQGFAVRTVTVRQSERATAPRIRRPGTYLSALLDIITMVFLTRFTRKPLRFFGLIGSAFVAAGSAALLYVIFEKFYLDIALAPRPALVLGALILMVGIQIIGIGLIGELLIFFHAKDVPEFHIKEVAGQLGKETEDDEEDSYAVGKSDQV